jgi:hypothetical protein
LSVWLLWLGSLTFGRRRHGFDCVFHPGRQRALIAD